jgi:N-acetylmuramoyl-L-alanine amidase
MTYRIALDCGHGKDTWTIHHSKGIGDFAEYDFNNQVGKYVVEFGKKYDFEFIITQPFDNNDVSLTDRSNLVKKEKADILVSIHANYADNNKIKGHSVYYWYTNSLSKKLAEIWKTNADHMLPNKQWNQGIFESKLNYWTNFHILREIHIPAILIESAFFSNSEELQLLKSDEFRRLCAMCIVKTLCDYFGIGVDIMELNINVFGKNLTLKDVVFQNDKNYVNFRELFTLLGCEVEWTPEIINIKLK